MGAEIVTREEMELFVSMIRQELDVIKQGNAQILEKLVTAKSMVHPGGIVSSGYISALDYMKAVGIKRWKFDQLISENKIRTIKKKRKIYVPVGEVDRFFKDPGIR